MPELQSRGLGTALMRDVIERAGGRGLPVRLSVVPANARAQRLYERLGFVVTAIEEPFVHMTRAASRD